MEPQRTWSGRHALKKLLIVAALLVLIGMSLVGLVLLFGTFTNWPMYLGAYAGLLESHYSVLIFGAFLLLLVLAYLLHRAQRTRLTNYVFIGVTSLFLWQCVVLAVLYGCAWSNALPLSFTRALTINFGEKSPHQTIPYLTLDGNEYLLDVYRPADSSRRSIPVVQVHGGGFVAGSRTMDPHHRWFTDRGLTVFDVDYPLGTDSVQTWATAPRAVATALSFVKANAANFNLDTTQLLLCGGSAGGGLVMQVGYGLGVGRVQSFSAPTPNVPTAIIAIYPPVDMTGLWNQTSDALDMTSNAKRYIGGSPTEFPERYASLDIINMARRDLPRTLIITGARDHVVPVAGSHKLVRRLQALKAPITYLEIPFGEHYFDGNANSLSGQLKWQAMDQFLRQIGLIRR
ncbi:putative hydrolase [Fibrella aestuarina BUZ 2]|uniref:Putative hydrolase n=1 Tax=Fibrella aestuarina BUZ 2 TaxID=1166018 RepID=I0KEI4_9BACT|nr:alpha/beta hydrolase [Fibrella aestuarina]CCH02537.1 putative hydrolase [Fibrella aestuarina BUZ 2]